MRQFSVRALALVAAVSALLAVDASRAAAQLPLGSAAPDIDLRTLDNERFQLSALKGRPVVLTFWGTWCPPCREEFPELALAYRKYHATGLEVVAVNQRDQEIATSDVQKFTVDFAVPFPVVLDTHGRSRRAYRLVGLPTTVFVNSVGVIVRVHSGPISHEQLATGLASIGVTGAR
jgi:thiol-disulfide isomerase/thioredoxin